MGDIWTVCGVGILAVFAVTIMREVRAELTVPTVLAVTVVFMCVLITKVAQISDFASKYSSLVRAEYLTVVFRALGIAYITSFSSDICQSLGQGSVASHMETIGRAEILLLTLPLLSEFLSAVVGV